MADIRPRLDTLAFLRITPHWHLPCAETKNVHGDFSMHPLTARSVRLLVPLFIAALAGCASSPPPAPAPVAKPSVVVPVAQLDRGVQIVLPDTLLFERGKAELQSTAAAPSANLRQLRHAGPSD